MGPNWPGARSVAKDEFVDAHSLLGSNHNQISAGYGAAIEKLGDGVCPMSAIQADDNAAGGAFGGPSVGYRKTGPSRGKDHAFQEAEHEAHRALARGWSKHSQALMQYVQHQHLTDIAKASRRL